MLRELIAKVFGEPEVPEVPEVPDNDPFTEEEVKEALRVSNLSPEVFTRGGYAGHVLELLQNPDFKLHHSDIHIDLGYLMSYSNKMRNISEPVWTIIDAMRSRPDSFTITKDANTFAIVDTVVNPPMLSISVIDNRYNVHSAPWDFLNFHERDILYTNVRKILKDRVAATAKDKRDDICKTYGVENDS